MHSKGSIPICDICDDVAVKKDRKVVCGLCYVKMLDPVRLEALYDNLRAVEKNIYDWLKAVNEVRDNEKKLREV